MKPLAIAVLTTVTILGMQPPAAFAASPEAWEKFGAEVESACTDAAAEVFRRPRAIVDPTGSSNFGLAILFGKSRATDERVSMICVYDKKTGTVELGSEMGKDLVRVRRPAKNQKTNQDAGQADNQMDDSADDEQ